KRKRKPMPVMKPKSEAPVPEPLRPYLFYGVGVEYEGNREPEAPCPLCGSDDRFYIARETGLFNCKKCGESGNLYIFLKRLLDRSRVRTKDSDYAELGNERGIAPGVLR